MKRWIRSATAALVLLAIPAVVWANRALPPPPPAGPLNKAPQSVKFVVVVDDSVKEPRLEVPANLLLAPDARRGDAAPAVPVIVVGLALAGAFVSGGLWLSKRGRIATSLVVALGLFALGGSALIADIAVPKTKPTTELKLPAGVELPAKVTLLVTEKGDAIKLIVPSGAVLKGAKPEGKPGDE